jgi:predicted permease
VASAKRAADGRLLAELRQTIRRLTRSLGFSVATIGVLALGLGVGTAAFNVINGFRQATGAGVPDATFVRLSPASGQTLTSDEARPIVAAHFESLSKVFATEGAMVIPVARGDVFDRLRVQRVMGAYFEAVEARPLLGRLIGPFDTVPGAPRVAVLSERAWREHFGADPDVIASTLRVGGEAFEVVGVGAVGGSRMGVGPVPLATDVWLSSGNGQSFVGVFARLSDGHTVAAADAEVRGRFRRDIAGTSSRALKVDANLYGRTPWGLYVVAALALFVGAVVLAVSGGSVALLLLARLRRASGDHAVRMMLGASVWDILRLQILEVGLLGVLALVVGVPVAALVARATVVEFQVAASAGTLAIDVMPDWRVWLYAASAEAVLGFAIVASSALWRSRRTALAAVVATSGVGAGTWAGYASRRRLITLQVAGCACLLMVAGVLVHAVRGEAAVDRGYQAAGVAVARMAPVADDRPGGQHAVDLALLEDVATVPGVVAAAVADALPGTQQAATHAESDASVRAWASLVGVTSRFFDVTGLALRDGTVPTAAQVASREPVAVVTAAAAATYWPEGRAVGRRLRIGMAPGRYLDVQVIGVVSDIRANRTDPPDRIVFVPLGLNSRYTPWRGLLVKGRGPAVRIASAVQRAVQERGHGEIIYPPQPLSQVLAARNDAPQFVARGLGVLGAVGFLLCLVGLYGDTACVADQRRRELAIRVALGATPMRLYGGLCREAVRLLAGGLALGAAFAAASLLVFYGRFQFLTLPDYAAILEAAAILLIPISATIVLPYARILRAGLLRALRAE